MTAVRASEAERVIVTHGSVGVMVRWLCQQGLDAGAFQTEFGAEEDESVGAAPAAGGEAAEASDA
jgi:putative mRNA 3-end processing factor